MLHKRILTHFHFCCGLGSGAKSFNRSRPRVGNVQAEWQCLGGIDVDQAGLTDFERLSGVKGTLLDLFTHDQHIRFHGKEPPLGWREATPDDVRRAAGGRRPDAVFISSPCKGASRLLSEKRYQALNRAADAMNVVRIKAARDRGMSRRDACAELRISNSLMTRLISEYGIDFAVQRAGRK